MSGTLPNTEAARRSLVLSSQGSTITMNEAESVHDSSFRPNLEKVMNPLLNSLEALFNLHNAEHGLK